MVYREDGKRLVHHVAITRVAIFESTSHHRVPKGSTFAPVDKVVVRVFSTDNKYYIEGATQTL